MRLGESNAGEAVHSGISSSFSQPNPADGESFIC